MSHKFSIRLNLYHCSNTKGSICLFLEESLIIHGEKIPSILQKNTLVDLIQTTKEKSEESSSHHSLFLKKGFENWEVVNI